MCRNTFFDYHREVGVDIRVARIFNTYGPNMAINDGRVVSNFIVQTLSGKDITIYGDGSQTRSLCYVDDLIDGLIKLMNTESVHQPINLGNPQERSIKQLAEEIIELTKSQSTIIYKELPEDDPMQRCPNIDRAKQLINWKPEIDFIDGIEKTIQYFKNKLFEN